MIIAFNFTDTKTCYLIIKMSVKRAYSKLYIRRVDNITIFRLFNNNMRKLVLFYQLNIRLEEITRTTPQNSFIEASATHQHIIRNSVNRNGLSLFCGRGLLPFSFFQCCLMFYFCQSIFSNQPFTLFFLFFQLFPKRR
ncbi:hypothetical protein D9B73_00420 [Serratia marcescens]|nr:hypothetical protein C7M66_25100 [Serratia marcescens]AXX27345.1 hypothetical protein C7M65_25070 [Serratia marcescens]RTE96653.1 hypothetical protein C7M70_18275 [Serratia marcescens]RTE96708.1 hypothetical protein C7M68_24875 [Serratia marcescens]RTF05281.1 hypothetical protein C7M69_25125 [Serratia marcescens]